MAHGYCQRTPQWEEIENDNNDDDDDNNNNNNNKFEKIGVCFVFEHNFGG